MIIYRWKPQWVEAPHLEPEQMESLLLGHTVRGTFGLAQWDLFRIEGKVAICYYADSQCWIRIMTDEETAYIKHQEETE